MKIVGRATIARAQVRHCARSSSTTLRKTSPSSRLASAHLSSASGWRSSIFRFLIATVSRSCPEKNAPRSTEDNPVDEVDPYKKPPELLQVSPKGLVPGLRFENTNPARGLNESTVILEFLEDSAAITSGKSLLPPKSEPYARALVGLQCDHINRNVVPAFYLYLQAQDENAIISGAKEFIHSLEGLTSLLERANGEVGSTACGLWNEDGDLGLTDVMAGPWLFRSTNVLKHYRGFELPPSDKFKQWIERLFSHSSFKATTSTEELYLDSYERYAFNRPNTSQVANAINSGHGLP